MKIADVIPKEKLMVFHRAAFEIIKEHLKEEVAAMATISLTRNIDIVDGKTKAINIFCDGYCCGMSTAMALIEAGIINIETLEIQKKKGGG